MAEFVRSPRSRHLSDTKAEEITRAIVNMVVQDYMPLRIVEGSGFENLMSLIAPEYSVPTRNTIKARIDKVYDEEKSKPHALYTSVEKRLLIRVTGYSIGRSTD